MRSVLLFLLISAVCGACVSPTEGSGSAVTKQHSLSSGTPARVTFVDYSDFQRLSLVNEAHTNPVEYYSEIRSDASTKITSNEVIEAMLEHFDDKGFSNFSQAGYAPRQAAPGEVQSLEVETEDGVRFLVYGTQASEESREAFLECRTAWVQIYNMTLQTQAVKNVSGDSLFEKPSKKPSKAPQKNR